VKLVALLLGLAGAALFTVLLIQQGVKDVGGLIATAGWEGGDLVIESNMLDLKEVQRWRVDGGTGRLVISAVAEASRGRPISYRLVYDRRVSGPVAPQ